MKKPYSKPMVSFEDYSLDMPIALNCSHIDTTKEFMAQQLFNEKYDCEESIPESFLGGLYGDDSLCYYSQVTTLFIS